MSVYSATDGFLEGPHRYRERWYSLRRKKWYRWHMPDGNHFLDVTPEVTRAAVEVTDEEWASLTSLLTRARHEEGLDVVDIVRSKKFWAIALGLYLLFWTGGRWSYSYTRSCVRSHKEDVYNASTQDVETVSVCDFSRANSKRWTLLDPIRVLIGWNF